MTAEEIDREHQADLQRLRGFRLLDDDFMSKCFEGEPKYIEFVLRIIMQMPELKVIHVETQVFVENLLKRSVRLDVLATDSDGRKINVEIQRSDQGAARQRARYNSSMMDVYLLKKGAKFYELPEAWVIFITENDVLGGGEPLYQIERCVMKTGEKFGDGSHILYVNGAYQGDTPLGKLMHDFFCTNPDDMYYEELAERVRFFKESKKGVEVMCRAMEEMRAEYLQKGIEEGIQQGIQQGIAQGIHQGIAQGIQQGIAQGIHQGIAQGVQQGEKAGREKSLKEVALRMLEAGRYALEEISAMSGLPLEELRTLQAEASA